MVERKASRSGWLEGLVIGRDKLDQLIAVTFRDLGGSDHLPFSTTRAHTEISAASLLEIASELDGITEIDNLRIFARGDDSRNVYIDLHYPESYYSVSSQDSTWTQGRYAEIDEIIQSCRTRFRRLFITLFVASIALAWGLFLVAIASAVKGQFDGLGVSATFGIIFAGGLAFTFSRVYRRAASCRILLVNVDTVKTASDKLAVAGLVVTVLAAIIALVQLVVDIVN